MAIIVWGTRVGTGIDQRGNDAHCFFLPHFCGGMQCGTAIRISGGYIRPMFEIAPYQGHLRGISAVGIVWNRTDDAVQYGSFVRTAIRGITTVADQDFGN